VFVLRRLLFIAVVAFAIVYFCVLGLNLSVNSTSPVGRTRSAWELAGPALEETLDFFGDTFRGDLGYVVRGITQRTHVPVMELLSRTFARSASLLALSVALATGLGIAAGGLAATYRRSPLSLPTLTLTVIGISIPSFFLALLFQVADIRFYQRTGVGLFPVYGISGHRTTSLLPQVIAPALVLAARPLAHITRVTFVSLSEVLNRDFIRTARAKGLRPSVVFWRHALRNTGVSILTAAVVSLRFALGSLPVVEVFFEWPGLGVTMLDGIYARETEVVAILALSLGVPFLLVNLLVDLLYRLIDPRLRTQVDGGGA
jgi:peptide/nickel transport system permease protein